MNMFMDMLSPDYLKFMSDEDTTVSSDTELQEIEDQADEAADEIKEDATKSIDEDAQMHAIMEEFDRIDKLHAHISKYGISREFAELYAELFTQLNLSVPSMESLNVVGSNQDTIAIACMEGLGDAAEAVWEFIKKVCQKIIEWIAAFFRWIASFFTNEEKKSKKVFDNASKAEKAWKAAGSPTGPGDGGSSSSSGSTSGSSGTSSSGSSSSGSSESSANSSSSSSGSNTSGGGSGIMMFNPKQVETFFQDGCATPSIALNSNIPKLTLRGEFHSAIADECEQYKSNQMLSNSAARLRKVQKPQKVAIENIGQALSIINQQYRGLIQKAFNFRASINKFLPEIQAETRKIMDALKQYDQYKNHRNEMLKTKSAVVKAGLRKMAADCATCKLLISLATKNAVWIVQNLDAATERTTRVIIGLAASNENLKRNLESAGLPTGSNIAGALA